MDEISIDPSVYENYYSYSYSYPQHWFFQSPDERNNTAVYNPFERLDVTPDVMQTPPKRRSIPSTGTPTSLASHNARALGLLSARTKLSPPKISSVLLRPPSSVPSTFSSGYGQGGGGASPTDSLTATNPDNLLGQFSPVREDQLMTDNHFIDIPDYSQSSVEAGSLEMPDNNNYGASHFASPPEPKVAAVDPRLSLRRESVRPISVGDDQSNSSFGTSTMGPPASVPAQRMRGNSEVSSSTQSSPPPPAQAGWPEELKDLIASIINRIDDNKRKAKVTTIIKTFVQEKHNNNEIWTTDWTNIVIPGLEEFTKKRKRKFELGPQNDDNFDVNAVRGRVHAEKAKNPSSSRSSSITSSHISVNLKGIGGGDSLATVGMRRLPYLRINFSENPPSPMPQNSNIAIVGSNMSLEKRYLRLTSAPDPSTVRPEHVLKDTIGFLKNRWQQRNDYNYICDQLKSVRQDLTVQMIRNEFTVKVYEFHARLALENNDLGEFNQCQSQLSNLYKEGISGNADEFTAYRILYFIHTKNKTALNELMRDLTPHMRTQKAIRHALHVRRAVATGNYSLIFKLHNIAPNMGAYLIDQFLDRCRVDALKIITKAYRQNIGVEFVGSELGFESPEKWSEFIARQLPEGQNDSIIYYTEDDGMLNRFVIDSKSAYNVFAEAAKRYSKVDIKGQL